MEKSIKEAIGSLTQDLLDAGLASQFTEKELKELGVEIPEVKNISPSIRQREQGTQTL
jgi:hypothetical protein